MRDTSRPVPFLASARAVFGLSLEGMLWSRRSLVLGAFLAVPVLIAIVYRVVLVAKMPAEITGLHLYGYLVALFWVRNALPLAALFYATALIADEVEGRTLTYLITRPVRRSAILAGKFAAYLVTTLCLALPAAVITFFMLATSRGVSLAASVPDLFRDLGVLALTLLVYGALFALMGVLMKRPLLPGLLFLFVWEMAANLPGYVPRFTITAWLRSLVTHRPAGRGMSEIFGQVLPADLGLAVLTALTVVFLWLAIWIFSRREYVLDQ
ncbi:MAG TPA: ABC transporter permease [Vicinamibacteria bacterium]|nr:ABC transporter permease [Vicinamibacteria bacterium]